MGLLNAFCSSLVCSFSCITRVIRSVAFVTACELGRRFQPVGLRMFLIAIEGACNSGDIAQPGLSAHLSDIVMSLRVLVSNASN
ncbi:hypothetical protein P171DRAFT_8542 [Karstenula rhodostoma CBS 690.94]|uniref:Uncharacterized protein n=1 Tax=Karstenula rhodostoma CBS 690.94 TaxID=1392251 RepID=A0A9P4PUG0_9PLEO|nr:hypothetical protein P171DRAFT_8542 [Karstenula rhodostoma CBS 690.94]